MTEDWAFISHRLPMAEAAADLGYEIVVFTRISKHLKAIEKLGYRVITAPFDRRNINPLREIKTVIALIKVLHNERPDIVHNVALKPILDGTLATLFCPVGHVVNTFTGLGAVFIGDQGKGWLRRSLIIAFRMLMRLRNVYSIVQNEDDRAYLNALGISVSDRTVLIRGSGVNIDDFPVREEPAVPIRATMVSRLLWDKGIGELIAAARLLNSRGSDVQVVLVGEPDPKNPNSISEQTYKEWQGEGIVEFQGYRPDIAAVWSESHIAILVSYREGLPKSLLEAASCGCAMIASDAPGCRELVKDGENGLLVPPRDATALADAIERLALDVDLRKKLGKNARKRVESMFSDRCVRDQTSTLYKRLLASPGNID